MLINDLRTQLLIFANSFGSQKSINNIKKLRYGSEVNMQVTI